MEDYLAQAGELLAKATDIITDDLEFMKAATDHVSTAASDGSIRARLDGSRFKYEPEYIIAKNEEAAAYPARVLLHSLCHGVFLHAFNLGRPNPDVWDLSCDMAVENLIVNLNLQDLYLPMDDEIRQICAAIHRHIADMTAINIYRYLLANPLSDDERQGYKEFFARDIHSYRKKSVEREADEKGWRRISDKIKIDLKAFTKDPVNSELFICNLAEATRPKYDYRRLLERFCQDENRVTVSEDEFDYIYYTYGITNYDGMPFVEPLELTSERSILDFAIVLDTSPACREEIILGFMRKTIDIIQDLNRYSEAINFHVIRGDIYTLSNTVIRNPGELDSYVKSLSPIATGGSDYRPAFGYMETLMSERIFNDFKGLIYFTDGRGPFPGKNPGYDCIFAFYPGIYSSPPEVPWWATPVIMDDDALLFEE